MWMNRFQALLSNFQLAPLQRGGRAGAPRGMVVHVDPIKPTLKAP
jgi:hypothetical protein